MHKNDSNSKYNPFGEKSDRREDRNYKPDRNQAQKDQREQRERINEQIRRPKVQLIDAEGLNRGIVNIMDAKRLADEAGLDLVEINAKVDPPVCKIVDYGKMKYERSKKQQQARKKQHTIKVKEVRLSPATEQHDLDTKISQIRRLLAEGNKVLINIIFRGREVAFSERGKEIIDTILTALEEVAKAEAEPRMEGKCLAVTLVALPPKKEKKEKIRQIHQVPIREEEKTN